jgi:hypothetical protein
MANLLGGLAEGLGPALTDFNKTQAEDKKTQFQQAIQTEKMGMEKGRFGMEQQEHALKMPGMEAKALEDKEKIKEIQKGSEPRDWKDIIQGSPFMASRADVVTNWLKDNGYDTSKPTTVREARELKQKLMSDPKQMSGILQKSYEKHSQEEKVSDAEIGKLQKDIADYKEKTMKDYQVPEEEKDTVFQSISSKDEKFQKIQKELQEKQKAAADIKKKRMEDFDTLSRIDGFTALQESFKAHQAKDPNFLKDLPKATQDSITIQANGGDYKGAINTLNTAAKVQEQAQYKKEIEDKILEGKKELEGIKGKEKEKIEGMKEVGKNTRQAQKATEKKTTKKLTSNVNADGFLLFSDGTVSDQKAGAKPKAGGGTDIFSEGPKKGDVVDGYVFQGGDPAKKENWKKK